jgi:inorganic pyrophosphatase
VVALVNRRTCQGRANRGQVAYEFKRRGTVAKQLARIVTSEFDRALQEIGGSWDVLVLTDEPVSVGCLILIRLIRVIRATQKERGRKSARNDRLIGVPVQATAFHSWKNLHAADDERIRAIEQFFISYHTVQGRIFRPLSRGGPAQARKLLIQAVRRAKSRS